VPENVSLIVVRAVKRALLGSTALVVAAHVSPACAQSTPPVNSAPAAGASQEATTDQASPNDIIVTAQFRGQSLQRTPLAITAVSADELDQRSITSVADLTSEAPSVVLKPASATYGQALAASIRGIGQIDSSFAYEPGVGIYVDDVYYATLIGSQLDLLDLDRVEILRGPQGTLTGQNSIGGAVKLFTKRPTGDGSGYLEGTVGSFNQLKLRGAVDISLVPDRLFARMSVIGENKDGFVKRLDYNCVNPSAGNAAAKGTDCELGTEGGRSYTGGRLALRWLASDNVEVNLAADVLRDRSETSPDLLLAVDPAFAPPGYDSRYFPTDPYATYAGFTIGSAYGPNYSYPTTNKLDSYGLSGTVDVALGDNLSLKSITAYRENEATHYNDGDGSPLGINLYFQYQRFRQFTQELRLNGETDNGLLEYTVGGFYLSGHGITRDRLNSGGLEFLSGPDPTKARTLAAYTTAIVHPTENLTVTGGLRYTNLRKEQSFVREAPDLSGPWPFGPTPPASTYKGSNIDYRFAVNYQFTPSFMVYAQTATGFKGGGSNPRPLAPLQSRPFGEEKLTSYEVGFKSRFLDNAVTMNGAAFIEKYKDIQLIRSSCPEYSPFVGFPCVLPENAGDATIKGAELEVALRPVSGLSIDGSVSYLDFQYDYILPSLVTGGAIDYNSVTPFTPKWKANAGIQYEVGLPGGSSITPRFNVSYQSSVYSQTENTIYNLIDRQTIANASVRFVSSDKVWQAILGVNNLFNKFYYNNKFGGNITFFGGASATPAPPREWSLTLRREF
jgi:iron complex outermembrane receptor protein